MKTLILTMQTNNPLWLLAIWLCFILWSSWYFQPNKKDDQ